MSAALAGRPIVVGIDGSAPSEQALSWAATEALRQGRDLRVVHAWEVWALAFGALPVDPESLREAAEVVLNDGLDQVRREAPGLAVEGVLVNASPVAALLKEAESAALVVLGSHGHGGFTGVLLGSTSVEVSARSTVPVVVVRGEEKVARWREARVVVGIDGSPVSEAALAFAFDAASRRAAGLTVVHAWELANPYVPEMISVIADEDVANDRVRVTMSESLAGWRERYPDVHVTQLAVRGHPVDALVAESADAALVVVGSRGRGGFRGMLLGSVSQGVLRHAKCPVAVVRPIEEAG